MKSRSLQLSKILALLVIFAFTISLAQEVSIDSFSLDDEAKEIKWVGDDYKRAFIRAKNHLWKSTDGGSEWKRQDSKLPSCTGFGCVSEMILSPVDPLTVFFLGPKGAWITDDRGDTYRQLTVKPHISEFRWHPTEKDWGLALRCVADKPDDAEYPDCAKELLITTDFGEDFSVVATGVSSADWANPKVPNFDKLDVFYGMITGQDAATGMELKNFVRSQLVVPEAVDGDITLTQATVLLSNAVEFLTFDEYFFVAVMDTQSSETTLHVTDDNGRRFDQIQLPNHLSERMFTIVDTSEATVFLNVFHGQYSQEPWGNVYLSDSTGVRYSVSLYRNRRNDGACDFHKINGLEGIYIANVVDNYKDQECAKCKSSRECNEKCHFVTKVTWNKGADWKRLPKPVNDENGIPLECPHVEDEQACNLHLHGYASTSRSPIYSSPNAPGMIIASGNVGPYLSTSDSAQVYTYLSRDAGVHWEQIRKGSFAYETIDYGNIVILVKNKEPTTEIVYSTDQGATFQVREFAKDPVSVTGIYTGSSKSRSVAILAQHQFKTQVYHVNFDSVYTEDCKGFGNPNDDGSDYEYFRPATYESSSCLMGREMEFTRRKRASQCTVSSEIEEAAVIRNCACTIEDYECDFEFERVAKDGSYVCEPLVSRSLTADAVPAECPSGASYAITKGYVKVAQDTCEGGDFAKYEPVTLSCPKAGLFTTTRGGISVGGLLLIIFILLLACALGTFILYKKSEKCHAFLADRLPTFARNVRYSSLMRKGGAQQPDFGLDDYDEDAEAFDVPGSLSNFSKDKAGASATLNGDDEFDPRTTSGK